MQATYQNPVYDYRTSPDQHAEQPVHHPLVIIGAGPVGMAAALDCARQGLPVVVLDDNNTVSVGSRAVCYAKRTLEIMDRLGPGQRLVDKGITWNHGRVFAGEGEVYDFNLQPEDHHRRPGFINLQQYYFEQYMAEQIHDEPLIDLRWKNRVTDLSQTEQGVCLDINTPDGPYRLRCDYLLVADGANSGIRTLMGLESKGQVFQERFLIADVLMQGNFPTERWFWFNPPFHQGQSTLLHRQADDVWRIDFDLGWDADPEFEKQPEQVIPRVRALLGHDNFELEWVSVYTFQCRRMEQFIHDKVIFIGDAAHQVSPFGARGANSGVQDADNLIWKLKLVLDGKAPRRLLDSYQHERSLAADENILNSTRSTDFISPKNKVSRVFRDQTLALARDYPFARAFVNSGRLSLPSKLLDSQLNTADRDMFSDRQAPGVVATDGPVRIHTGEDSWLLNQLGNEFCAVFFAENVARIPVTTLQSLRQGAIPIRPLVILAQGARGSCNDLIIMQDKEGVLFERFDATPGSLYLFRPDQHVCARWRQWSVEDIRRAQAKACANLEECEHE
ncbi:FAD-dependent oxidoreductase [Zobellella maritima]|uniref:FAD-dependent oxidoreductase n=1 Tax=Zobellella maritima TaxID=2059725 RepID=UPI000E3035E4|nr:FAD-dependent oxidoreductase [Zobellella maritima]